MSRDPERIRWSPKLKPERLSRLYRNDAIGAVDEVLVQDVGLALLARCRSIRLVTAKSVECPRCGTEFVLSEHWKMTPGERRCPGGCGWSTTPAEWHDSWRKRDLLGAAAMEACELYLSSYPAARSSGERMICIDQLIHAFHLSLKTGKAGRSFASNLIEGSHAKVTAFLDSLSGLPGGVDKEAWRVEMERVRARRRGEEPSE